MGRDEEPTIFEMSVPGRRSWSFPATDLPEWTAEELVPADLLRDGRACALHHRCESLWTNDNRLARASLGFVRNVLKP